MSRRPFPKEYVYDESDLPPGSGWSMPGILKGLERGELPEDFRRFFDRDPERVPPADPGAALAPADGLLELRRRPGRGPEFVIHLRLTDVHVQRAPFAGVVRSIERLGSAWYYPDDEGYWGGVRAVTAIDTARGAMIVTQLSTLITRRIETFLEPGQSVLAGERLGRIRLGSTVLLELPEGWTALAKDGERVWAGETVLARAPA